MDQKTADMLRGKYPNHIPLEVAAKYLNVSPRRLSQLIAEGREPFKHFGANIGVRQNYARIYTEPFIAFLSGQQLKA